MQYKCFTQLFIISVLISVYFSYRNITKYIIYVCILHLCTYVVFIVLNNDVMYLYTSTACISHIATDHELAT